MSERGKASMGAPARDTKTPGACVAIAGKPTNRRSETNSQRRETAECKDIKGLRIKKLVLGEATDAETDADAAVAVVRVVVAAVGRTAVRGVVVPRPAAQQPWFISSGSRNQPRLVIVRGEVVTLMPVVLAPLIHIAVHIVQAPAIGREAGHVDGLLAVGALGAASINIIAVVVGQIRRQRGPEMERCGAAGTAGVLPLGLARQAVTLTRALAHAAAELQRIKPAHLLHRTVRSLEIRGI